MYTKQLLFKKINMQHHRGVASKSMNPSILPLFLAAWEWTFMISFHLAIDKNTILKVLENHKELYACNDGVSL